MNVKSAGTDNRREENTGEAACYALPGQLCVGLYIYIDLPWFGHSFTLNSFRISSAEQIRELRALNKPRFRYDPKRSTVTPGVDAPEAAVRPVATAAECVPDLRSDAEPAMAAADPGAQMLREYREAVARTEKSFAKALGVMRRLDRNLLSHPAETLEEMQGLVVQMATVFLDHPEATLQVMGESSGGEEVYHHSLNVSILCMMLSGALNLTREEAEILGTGALLHDIGLNDIPGSVLKEKAGGQTRPECGLRAMHAAYGVKTGARLGLAPAILSIIGQHHELADGTGYPGRLGLEQIAPLARIVSLVNFYDNLCNPADISQAMTPHEALAFLFTRRKGQFDTRVLQVMIRCLGVYPPGSIVKLSNDAIAMVVSTRPQMPLRPWVVLYDAAVPREDAAMLNLEAVPDVNISSAIRPALLPAAAYAYLSPRKRITYFFDAGSSHAKGGK